MSAVSRSVEGNDDPTMAATFGLRHIRFTPTQSVSTALFQSKSRVLGWAFAIRWHCRHTPLRLQCDLTLPPTVPTRSNAYRGRTPGRCDCPERRPISIGIEPEGIIPHANVKPGAGLRGIAAAKETCSGTN